jgi:uncharacterized protein YoxC
MKYKINGSIKKNYGGGGGNTVSSIPDWAAPYMKNVGNAAESAYGEGELGKVAGASELQQKAFGTGAQQLGATTSTALASLGDQNKRLSTMATTPSAETLAATKAGIVQDAQKKVAGLNTGFGAAGTLGSARQAVMQGAQNAETTAQLAKVDADYEANMFKNRLAAESALQSGAQTASGIASGGVSSIANLGNQQRAIDQQGLDSTWQGLQRYASTIYGNPARQQATGGK